MVARSIATPHLHEAGRRTRANGPYLRSHRISVPRYEDGKSEYTGERQFENAQLRFPPTDWACRMVADNDSVVTFVPRSCPVRSQSDATTGTSPPPQHCNSAKPSRPASSSGPRAAERISLHILTVWLVAPATLQLEGEHG